MKVVGSHGKKFYGLKDSFMMRNSPQNGPVGCKRAGQNWSPTVTQCFWNFYRITVVPHQLYKQATEHVCYPRPSAACPFPIVSSWGDASWMQRRFLAGTACQLHGHPPWRIPQGLPGEWIFNTNWWAPHFEANVGAIFRVQNPTQLCLGSTALLETSIKKSLVFRMSNAKFLPSFWKTLPLLQRQRTAFAAHIGPEGSPVHAGRVQRPHLVSCGTDVITGSLDMCKICTEAVDCVALWTWTSVGNKGKHDSGGT